MHLAQMDNLYVAKVYLHKLVHPVIYYRAQMEKMVLRESVVQSENLYGICVSGILYITLFH